MYGTSERIKKGLWSGMESLSNPQKVTLAATAIVAYVAVRAVLAALGLPAVPGFSSLLLLGQPAYAVLVAGIICVLLTLMAWPIVGLIREDAPLFCAAIGLLALPTHGGDARNALLDAGSASVYVRMMVELVLLGGAVLASYVLLVRLTPAVVTADAPQSPPDEIDDDSLADRLYAVGVQALIVLGLMSLLGQSPLKGQAMIAVALSGGIGAWLTYKSRLVHGSLWYVAGTLLAGAIAYAWTGLHPISIELGDTRGYLAGAARSLPLHYATAGVAGTIYGYWGSRSGEEEEA